MRSATLSSVGPSFAALLGLVGASLTMPSVAAAQSTMETSLGKTVAFTGHGVGIVSCSVDHYADVTPTTDGTPSDIAQIASGIHVAFVNGAEIAADAVTVVVSYAGEQRSIVDRGHFSPGITIDHRFTAFAGDPFLAQTPDSCIVASVHFEGTPSLL